jgi:hypothetical protein
MKHCNITPDIFSLVDVPTQIPREGILASATTNAGLIANAAALYIRKGDIVADVTFGRGVFWQNTDCRNFKLLASDLWPVDPIVTKADFRNLPYEDGSFDVVVMDPPYAHHAARHLTGRRYDRLQHTKHMDHAEIIQLFRDGMIEAKRVLRAGGRLFVKCKDEIQSGKQCRSDIEIWLIATKELDLTDLDRFTLHSKPVNQARWQTQKHARKTDSYLWVFGK